MSDKNIEVLTDAVEVRPAEVGTTWKDVPSLTDAPYKIVHNLARETPHHFIKSSVDGRRALLIVEAAKG